MTRGDVEALRAAGFSDTAIHDVVQVTGFFSYYNRLADGLGIDPEPPSSGH
jgi:alkylhydroperoxidase family enzyme